MRTYLKISVNLDTGEADFTDSSIAQIDEWTGNNPLFAADILQDIYYSTKWLYDDALKAMREEYNNLRLSQETQQ
jgi:hypothetical protein